MNGHQKLKDTLQKPPIATDFQPHVASFPKSDTVSADIVIRISIDIRISNIEYSIFDFRIFDIRFSNIEYRISITQKLNFRYSLYLKSNFEILKSNIEYSIIEYF